MTTTADIPTKDFSYTKGDSDEILVSVTEPDPNSTTTPPARIPVRLDQAVDGTADRRVVMRFAAKEDADDTNAAAAIYKDDSDPEDIVFLDQTTGAPPTGSEGQAVIYIDKQDTEDNDAGPVGEPIAYPYDVEVTRQDFIRAGAQTGTISLVAGENTVMGVATTFSQARVGDVLQPLGGINDNRPAVIQEVIDDLNVRVSHSNWVNEPSIAFEIRRGRSFTAARGNICLEQGQVSEANQ